MSARCSTGKDDMIFTQSSTLRPTSNVHLRTNKQRDLNNKIYEHGMLNRLTQHNKNIQKMNTDLPESSSGKRNLESDFNLAYKAYTTGNDDLDIGIILFYLNTRIYDF